MSDIEVIDYFDFMRLVYSKEIFEYNYQLVKYTSHNDNFAIEADKLKIVRVEKEVITSKGRTEYSIRFSDNLTLSTLEYFKEFSVIMRRSAWAVRYAS